MPWHIGESDECPPSKPFAVIKDSDGSVAGCHDSKAKAKKQLAALYASEGRMTIEIGNLVNTFKRLVGKTPKEERMEPSSSKVRTMIQRQKDGTYRWFSVSGSAALNKDGEIDSRALYDSFIAIARATGRYPKRDFMHLGGKLGEIFEVGQTDFLARDGNFLISSGVYFDNELARAEIAARQTNPDDWGDSNEFMALERPEIDGEVSVFNFGYLRRIATVPQILASSHFTAGTVTQEVDRMLQERDLEALTALMGDEERVKQWLEKHVSDPEEALAEAGTMTRTTDVVEESSTDTVVEVEEPVETVVEVEATEGVIEYEIDDELVDEIVARAKGDLEGTLAEVVEKIKEVDAALKAMAESAEASGAEIKEAQAEVQERLAKLEVEEGEKLQTWYNDMPRKQVARATYRPRDGGDDDGEVPASDRLDHWNTKHDDMYSS